MNTWADQTARVFVRRNEVFTVKRVILIVDKVVLGLIVAFSTVMVASTFLQVVFRYFLDHPLSWSEELSRFCFIWIVYLGTALAAKSGSHIGVDYLYKRLKTAVQLPIFVFTNLLILCFVGVVFFESIPVIGIDMSQHSPAIGIPMGLVYLAIPTGFGLIFFYVSVQVASRLKDVSRAKRFE